jgi:molecular chaperone DnaJ
VQVTVRYTDAILGCTYEVPTLHGTALLDIPPGTQHGASLYLPGQGVTPLKSGISVTDPRRRETGSHIYEVVMRVPLQVSEAERRLLEQLQVV